MLVRWRSRSKMEATVLTLFRSMWVIPYIKQISNNTIVQTENALGDSEAILGVVSIQCVRHCVGGLAAALYELPTSAAPKFKLGRLACGCQAAQSAHHTSLGVRHARQSQAHFDPTQCSHQHELVEV